MFPMAVRAHCCHLQYSCSLKRQRYRQDGSSFSPIFNGQHRFDLIETADRSREGTLYCTLAPKPKGNRSRNQRTYRERAEDNSQRKTKPVHLGGRVRLVIASTVRVDATAKSNRGAGNTRR